MFFEHVKVGNDFITTCKAVIFVITSVIYFISETDDENRIHKIHACDCIKVSIYISNKSFIHEIILK